MDRLNTCEIELLECLQVAGQQILVATDESVLSLTTRIITSDNWWTGHLVSGRECSADIVH